MISELTDIINEIDCIDRAYSRLELKKQEIINAIHNHTLAINTKINYDKRICRKKIKFTIIKLLYRKSKIEIEHNMMRNKKNTLIKKIKTLHPEFIYV